MELKGDKAELVTRLACCAVAAFILWYLLDYLLEKRLIPQLEPYRPWLAENKVQAIAIAAAVLYGASLALFPAEEDGADREDGYCQVEKPV